MKAYKNYVNEETMKIDIVEFDVDWKRDYSHDPITNLCDSDNKHSIRAENKIEYTKRLNTKITNGKYSLVRCKDCNRYFLLSKKEKEWFTNRGLFVPKRCPKCRKEKKK